MASGLAIEPGAKEVEMDQCSGDGDWLWGLTHARLARVAELLSSMRAGVDGTVIPPCSAQPISEPGLGSQKRLYDRAIVTSGSCLLGCPSQPFK